MNPAGPPEAVQRALDGLLRELPHAAAADEALIQAVLARLPPLPARPRRFHPAYWWAGAAALLAVVGGLWFWTWQRPAPLVVATVAGRVPLTVARQGRAFAAAPGDRLLAGDALTAATRADLVLSEASQVRLDRGTRLTLAAPAAGERVCLALGQGRIFVRATPAPGRFVVATPAVRVEVTGTVFGVAQDAQAVRVHVLDGAVGVTAAAATLPVARGQSARARAGAAPTLNDENPTLALAWARDWTEFRQRPLREVIAWIEGHTAYRFHLESAAVADKVVTLAVADEAVPDLVGQLAVACGLTWRLEGNEIHLWSD